MSAIYVVEMTAKLDQCVLRGGVPVDVNGTWYVAAQRAAYDPTKAYTVTGSVRRDASANGDMYMGVTWFDSNGVRVTENWIAASGVTPGTSWGTYSGTIPAGSHPFGAGFLAPTVVLNHSTGTLGYHECQSLRLTLSTTPTVALNGDEFFRDPAAWERGAATVGQFARLFDGTPYTETLRFATQGFMTRPSDTPANTYIDGRLKQPAMLRQEMPASYAGACTVGFGEMTLANGDGGLSHLAYAGLDGQTVRLLVGDADAAFSSFNEVFRATAEQAVFDDKQLTVRLKDGLSVLDRPLLSSTFLGNNALPAGLEGGDDIKGLLKPKLFGRVANLPAPCVNTSRLIYLVTDGGFTGASGVSAGEISAVYDRGVALTAGATYASQADMEATAPAAGQYRAWLAGGMFRLGSTPAGLVTCDAACSVYTENAWHQVLPAIAKAAGVLAGAISIDTDTVGYYKPDNWPGVALAEVGVWVNDGRTAVDAMDVVARGSGVFFGWMPNSGTGGTPRLFAAKFPHAYGTRNDTGFTGGVWYPQEAVLSVRPVAASEEGAGVPAWRAQLRYAPVLTVQEFDVDAGVTQARKSFLANERRQLTVSDAAIKDKHANAVTYAVDTQIHSEAAASEEATRQLQLRRYRRAWFEVTVALAGACYSDIGNPAPGLKPRLGAYVRLTHPAMRVVRQDGTATTDSYFNVMALEFDYRRGTARMTVRQATEPTL